MQAYYDIAKADRFNTLFDGLWIQQHPTPLKNAFQIIYLDFSIIGAGMGNLEEKSTNIAALSWTASYVPTKISTVKIFTMKCLLRPMPAQK